MSLSRRKMLSLVGGGAILAATAGAGVTMTRKPQTALAPWRLAGSYEDPRMRALSYALLAPNPHNRQPWVVDLSQPDTVILYVDPERLLPHTDPFSRQITVGLGCFLELMRMAAAEEGRHVELDLFPEGEDAAVLDGRPIAICTFDNTGGVPDPLFAHVFARRSLKEPYDTTRPVPEADLARLTQVGLAGSGFGVTRDAAMVADLRDLTREALVVEFETPHTYKESVDLFRIGAREVDANPDGLDFSGPMWEALRMTGLFSREEAMNRDGFSYAEGLRMVQETAMSGMAYVWSTTPGNSRAEQIAAGRDWIRLNLTTTALGLGLQPMSQALQEYPEMSAHYAQAHRMLAPEGGIVQMLGRLGYGPDVPVSPRWPLEAKIRTS